MHKSYQIGNKELSIVDISNIINLDILLSLSSEAKDKIKRCRKYLENKISESEDPIYGVNTGFGALCNHKISVSELVQLQRNLVLSHACGTGDEVPVNIVRIMLLLKIQSLAYGKSGVQLKTVERLIDMFNNKVLPVIYQQGSLGASGDLAPLAHMCLPLIGEGEVNVSDNGYYKKIKSADILKEFNWDVIELQSKEGLALLNGTQFMSAYGAWSLIQSQRFSFISDLVASISLEAFNCRLDPFNVLIHNSRPHKGQIKTANNINKLLENSSIQKLVKNHVQDPYSFRCIPQVHGATKDVLDHVKSIFNTEINSVTDNPIVFVDEDEIISGGNFHGQPLSMAMDYLAISLSELGSISERRTYQLISGQRDLPLFLVAKAGLNSGMMIPQYTAASIVSQNKQLCTPSSVDSIVSSNGQEDHVSMGANAATKLYQVVKNLERILAIEMLSATQALAFRNTSSSNFIEKILNIYRREVSFLEEDRVLHKDIQKTISFFQHIDIDQELV